MHNIILWFILNNYVRFIIIYVQFVIIIVDTSILLFYEHLKYQLKMIIELM